MATLNIPSSVNDPSYRYKMPRILTQKECRGRGSKTSILNMGAVAQAIQRDPAYLMKFFGYELGAQTTYTNKKSEGERAVVNGHHDTLIFQNLVDKFIEKYVLCPACSLPETDMAVNKSRLVGATCRACGWNGALDNQHHLAEYISRHPPQKTPRDGDSADKKGKKDKKEKKEAKAQQRAGIDDSETASYQSDDGQEEQKGKKERKEKKEKKTTKASQMTGADDTETASYQSEDGEEERKGKKHTSEKKEKKEKKERKTTKVSSGVEKDSDEEEQDLSFDGEVMAGVVRDIAGFVQGQGGELTVESLYEEVRAQQVTKQFDHKLRMYVVVSALFPNGTLNAKGATSRSEFLKAFITNGALSFADWIWGFEAYMAANPTAKKTWGMTLKSLYDADLVDEEEILCYYKDTSRCNPGFDISLAAAAPFINWLETTPDEDSD